MNTFLVPLHEKCRNQPHSRSGRSGTAQGQKEFPPQQIEWYLDRSRRDFGILTNGRLWRLIPRVREPHQRRFDTFYEIDLPDFLERWTTRLQDVDDFLLSMHSRIVCKAASRAGG